MDPTDISATRSKPARMREVAQLAGVSTITVSRTLRTPEMVSDKTRERVLTAVRRLNYLPNSIAASLSSNRTNIVAAIIPTLSNVLYASMLQGLSEVLRAEGLHLMISTSGLSMTEEESVVAAALAQRPCGFLLHQTRHTKYTRDLLLGANIPIVEVGDLTRKPLDTVVSYSNYAAAKAMTKHLATSGYRRIGIVVSPMSDRAKKRYAGYRAALRDMGLPYPAERRVECASGYDNGARAIVELIERDPSVDAVLFSSIASAVGAWFECQRRGWQVPLRIAIASFDDTQTVGWMAPPLTVVRLPRLEVGQRAGTVILERLQGHAPASHRHDLGFQILCREST